MKLCGIACTDVCTEPDPYQLVGIPVLFKFKLKMRIVCLSVQLFGTLEQAHHVASALCTSQTPTPP